MVKLWLMIKGLSSESSVLLKMFLNAFGPPDPDRITRARNKSAVKMNRTFMTNTLCILTDTGQVGTCGL